MVQVGSGTFGSVYFVRDRETGDGAAAKYLRQVTFCQSQVLTAFKLNFGLQEKSKVRREAEVLRSLIQSAFVVQLVGLYESPLNSVLVTEYLAGGDLITRYFTTLLLEYGTALLLHCNSSIRLNNCTNARLYYCATELPTIPLLFTVHTSYSALSLYY